MTITLYYRFKNETERQQIFTEDEILIGRPKGQPLQLDLSPDINVSRPHARLYYDLGTWWVADLGSKHGTLLNGEKVSHARELAPGDHLQFGETAVRVEFAAPDMYPGSGKIESQVDADECRDPQQELPPKQFAIFQELSGIIGHSKSQDAKLERLLEVLKNAFPTSERQTVLFVAGKELRPQVFWPPDEAHASITLARQALTCKQAFLWVRAAISSEKPIPSSLAGTLAALYAPMISGGKLIGVIHVDSVSSDGAFNDRDVQFFGCLANFMAAALQEGIRADVGGNTERLRQQISDLQRCWDLLSQKITRLRAQHVAETRTEEKFRLEHVLAETTNERKQVEQQLQDLEQQLAEPECKT